MKRIKTNGHIFSVGRSEPYWKAICIKCGDEYYFKKLNDTKKDIISGRPGCYFDHDYYCLINKKIKVICLLEDKKTMYVEKIDKCPITLSETEIIIKNIIE